MSFVVVSAVSGEVFARHEVSDAQVATSFFEGLHKTSKNSAGRVGIAILMDEAGPAAFGRAMGNMVIIEATTAGAAKLQEAVNAAKGKSDEVSDFVRFAITNVSINDDFKNTRFA